MIQTLTKPNRIQVAFNSNPDMDTRIKNLNTRYAGLSLAEIIKLAIINLDKPITSPIDETDYLLSFPANRARLLESVNNISTSKQFTAQEFDDYTNSI